MNGPKHGYSYRIVHDDAQQTRVEAVSPKFYIVSVFCATNVACRLISENSFFTFYRHQSFQ